MNTVVEDQAQQSFRLGSHEAELNRIDTAFVGAVRDGTACLLRLKFSGR